MLLLSNTVESAKDGGYKTAGYSPWISIIVMTPTTLLSSAVLIGLAAAILTEAAPGATRIGENDDTFLRPAVHRKRENPVIRSGIRTGRPGLLDSLQHRRRRLIRTGGQTVSESTGQPEPQKHRHQAEFGMFVPGGEHRPFVPGGAHRPFVPGGVHRPFVPGGEHRPFVRQSRRIKTPQKKMDNSINTWIKDKDSGVMTVGYGMNGNNSDVNYCPYCRQEEPEHYRLIPYHQFASSVHPHQSDQAARSSYSPVAAGPGHVKHDPDLQEETTVMSGEQRGKGLDPKEEVETNSKSAESGSAEAKEENGGYDEEVSKNV
jgi:hypothetical protein